MENLPDKNKQEIIKHEHEHGLDKQMIFKKLKLHFNRLNYRFNLKTFLRNSYKNPPNKKKEH